MAYTLADYERAKAEVESLSRSSENYMGGNPHKFETRLRDAHDNLRVIEHSLLENGLLEPTEHQAANLALDKLHPFAKAKTRAEFRGKSYEVHYWRESISLSGKTTRLRHEWRLVDSAAAL